MTVSPNLSDTCRQYLPSGVHEAVGFFLLVAATAWCADEAVSQTSQTEAPLIARADQRLDYTLGVGLSVEPSYLGSDDYSVTPIPILALQYGPLFLDPIRGLGIEYANELGFYGGVSLQLDPGRRDDDDLKGLGRVRSSRVLDVSLSQALAEWVVLDAGVSVRIAGNKDRGKQYRVGLTVIPWQTDDDVITLGISAQLGDEDYNQTYFGVTPDQASRTRFAAFTPSSGVHAQTLTIGWSHVLNRHWTLDASADVTRLGGKVKKSPIVFDDTNYSLSAGITYTF